MRSLALGLVAAGTFTLAWSAGCGGGFENGGGAGGGTSSGGAGGGTSSSGGTGATGGGSSSSGTSASSGTGTSSNASSGSVGSSGSGGAPMGHGDCQIDSDCAPGGQCVEVTPGGFRVCQYDPTPATMCMNPVQDQCCDDKPCPNGEPCYLGPLVPYCGGIVGPDNYNQCAVDQCASDGECPEGFICAIAGTIDRKIRACVYAPCKVDADCGDFPGGYCAPVVDSCCGAVGGLYCVYPNNGGCLKDGDCPVGQFCVLGEKTATCSPSPMPCPL
jgi:hypothetical protein